MQRLFILASLLLSILIPLVSALPAPIQPTLNLSLTPSSTNQGTVATTSSAPTPHPTEQAHLLPQLHKRQGTSIWTTNTGPLAPTTEPVPVTTASERSTNPFITTAPITESPKTRPPNPTTDPKTATDGGGGIPVTTATIILPSPSSGSGGVGGSTASKGSTVGGTGIGAGGGSGTGGLTVPTSGPGSVPNNPKSNSNNSGSGSGSSSSSGSSVGAIIGGIAAAVVIIAAMAGFLFYRRRNRMSSLDKAQDRLDAKERAQGAGGGGNDDPPLMEDGKIEEALIDEKDVTGEGARASGSTSAAATEEELGGLVTRIRGPQVLHADINDLNIKTPLHEFEAQRNSWLTPPPPLGESPRSPQDTIQQDHLLRLLRVQQEQMEKLQHLVVQHRRSQTPQSPHALNPAVEGGDSSGIASGTGFGGGDGVAVQNLVSPGKSHEPKDLDRSDLSGVPASKLNDIDDDGYSVTTTKVDDNSNTTSQSNSNNLVEFVTPGAANINTATAFCADRDSVVTDPTVSSTTCGVSEETAALISAIAAMKAQYDEQYQLIHEDLAGASIVP